MRALVCKNYGSPDDLVMEEVGDPVAGGGEILVDIEAAGLNFPDVLVIGGQYQVKMPPPFISDRFTVMVFPSIVGLAYQQ